MAFAQNWVESDPDGSIITGSLLDDWIRNTKVAVRERMEGDPALNLTGIVESGSWIAAPMPKMGAARVWAVTAANLGTVPLQDGRVTITTDSHRIYHMATAGYYEVDYLSKAGGGIVTGAAVFTGGVAADVTGTFTGTVMTAAQANITSVGTLTALAVNAAITINRLGAAANPNTLLVFNRAGAPKGYLALDANDDIQFLNSVGSQTLLITGAGVATIAGHYVGALTGNVTGTILTAAQPNITSLGNLTSLTVAGALNGTLSTAAQPNITSVGTLTSLSVSGGITGTLLTAAQPNITSLGTLTTLTVSGAVSAGVVTVTGLVGLTATSLGAPTANTATLATIGGAGSPVATLTQAKWLPITGSDALVYYVPAWR